MESLCCSGKARTKKPATRAGFDVVRTLASAYSEEERLKFAPPSARWELRLQALKAFLPPPQTPVFLKVMNSSYKNITIDATNIEKNHKGVANPIQENPTKGEDPAPLVLRPRAIKGATQGRALNGSSHCPDPREIPSTGWARSGQPRAKKKPIFQCQGSPKPQASAARSWAKQTAATVCRDSLCDPCHKKPLQQGEQSEARRLEAVVHRGFDMGDARPRGYFEEVEVGAGARMPAQREAG